MGGNGSKPSPPQYIKGVSKAEFELLLDYFSTVATAYKKRMLKYIKELEYRDYYKEKAPWYGDVKASLGDPYSLVKSAIIGKSLLLPSINWINFGTRLPNDEEWKIGLDYTQQQRFADLARSFEAGPFVPILAAIKEKFKAKLKTYQDKKKAQMDLAGNGPALIEEYNRQMRENEVIHVPDTNKWDGTKVTLNVNLYFNPAFYPGVPPNTLLGNWIYYFTMSDEYKLWLKTASDPIQKQYEKELATQEETRLSELTKLPFSAGKIYEEMDVDSINYDLIRQLQEQEEDYNNRIIASKADLDKSIDAQKAHYATALEELKKRIETDKQTVIDKISGAIKKNEDNAQKREAQKNKIEKAEQDAIDEDRALASLTNYSGCSSSNNRENIEKLKQEKYQDDDIQGLIESETNRILGKGKSKMSIAEQVYMMNQRYIDNNQDDNIHIRTNSANKTLRGGGIAGDVSTGIGVIAIALPPPANVIAGVISGLLAVFDLFDGKAKEEAERRKLEEEARQEALFQTWVEEASASIVSTLEGETDPKIFEKKKRSLISNFLTNFKGQATESEAAVEQLTRDIDAAHDETMKQRKEILDKITENGLEVINKGQELVDDFNNTMDQIKEEDAAKRDEITKPFLDELNTKLEEYLKKEEERDKIAEKEQNYKDKVNERLAQEYDKLDQQEAELRGYSGCSANAVNIDAVKHQVKEEIDKQAKLAEEAKAQGVPVTNVKVPENIATNASTVAPIAGAGKSSRTDIVKKIMKEKGLSMIEASKYVKQKGLYKK